ncbi:hypothetical protein M409DRAFT_68223 [Zasmidium cellare ATCC 36951]|uniref:U6 snRNA phosphodiesterase n=1 Tax=Zasmidium cellare ATCC 36951 TaxID=1080233 RepID=A0A6A6C9X9_ZASCE|nr:uncharacterized protein M409DRAFT_68223 [Zasmidium cellare ATCC 36951]KAF2163997.1 hypothetical protein M409DRAFT_68223 [Zasmidium cellare ATCC 36951]
MALVDYSDSDSDDSNHPDSSLPPAKKRRVSGSDPKLPPLPPAFRDLYSSAVRTSTQDDPSLHGGRKRVTPHVAGNWPAHVYLEWNPEEEDYKLLRLAVRDVQHALENGLENVHSLLQNDLGVQLPLHVSLSRPLSLKTEQKNTFLNRLRAVTAETAVREFDLSPANLIWHPNEDATRWFLVLKLERTEGRELPRLLQACNRLAKDFGQPLLYEEDEPTRSKPLEAEQNVKDSEAFHVSIAWSLQPPTSQRLEKTVGLQQAVPADLRKRIGKTRIDFADVKVRVGQDVSSIALPKRRTP